MASPNIVGVTVITGRTDALAVSNSPQFILSNSVSSGEIYKVNFLNCSNVSAGAVTVTVDLYISGTAYHLAYQYPVPAGASLDILTKSIYVDEGVSLRLTASANSAIEAVCSYEVLT